jgi:acetyl-CoA C-acetyltransferase
MKNVVIVAAKRTPVGSFGGSLSSFTAPELGASVIFSLVKQSGIKPNDVQEVVMGNVLTAGIGQAPARQAAIKAGLSEKTPATTVNKVCASGTKAIMIAADQIALGQNDIMIAGGMESMSKVPYYLPRHRFGSRLGHVQTEDGIIKDGLWDVYRDFHMGNAGEICAKECNISREQQDEYAITSYKRAIAAHENGYFRDELITVKVKDRKGNVTEVKMDEELEKVNFEKIPRLRPVFSKEGTITAANASSINDGAAGVLLMSEEKAKELGLEPVARILSHGSAAKAPEWFTTAPADAIPIALKRAGLD